MGGVPFVDDRVDFTKFKDELKGKAKFGQLPILTIDDSELYQSTAICTYCAKVAGLYPKDDAVLAAKIDEVICFVNQDIKDRLISKSMAKGLSDEDKAAMRKDLNDTTLPEKLAILESMVSDSGYFFENISMADLTVYTFLNWIGMGVLDGISNEIVLACPKLKVSERVIRLFSVTKLINSQTISPRFPSIRDEELGFVVEQ